MVWCRSWRWCWCKLATQAWTLRRRWPWNPAWSLSFSSLIAKSLPLSPLFRSHLFSNGKESYQYLYIHIWYYQLTTFNMHEYMINTMFGSIIYCFEFQINYGSLMSLFFFCATFSYVSWVHVLQRLVRETKSLIFNLTS